MQTRTLGTNGPQVSALGLGLMGMSGMYGPADEAESIATVHAALDAGITLLDTGDFYGMGHNELLLSRALTGRDRDAAVISVKFGAQRGPDGSWLDPNVSIEDTVGAIAELVQADYVRHIGLDANLRLVDALRGVAESRHASVAQVAIAWVAAQGHDIVPLVGARRRDRSTEALGALDLTFSQDDLDAIEAAVPAGSAAAARYVGAQLAPLDSERSTSAS